jgi:hypothetical protein
MKKYLLFIFKNYYPFGGFEDYVDIFDSIEDAHNYWLNIPLIDRDTNCQIVDLKTLKIVKEDSLDN